MARLVALVRAVNVGGTEALSMKALTAACERCGFSSAVAVLQSANVTVEELVMQGRDLFVHYLAGQGRSQLKLPRASEKATTHD